MGQASAYPKLYALMHNTPNLNNQFLRGTSTKSNVLKTATDSIATHHSVIQNLHVTSQLQDNTVTTNLSNTKIKGTTSGTVSGTAQSSSISGTASGQSFTTTVNLPFSVTIPDHTHNTVVISSSTSKITGGDSISRHGDNTGDWDANYTITGASGTPTTGKTSKDGGGTYTGNVKGTVSGTGQSSTITGTATGQKFTSNKATWDLNGELITGYSTGKVTNGNVTGTIDNSDVLYSGKKNTYSGRDETAPMHMFVRFLIRAAE
ncbi:MAG: hypothetical protein IKO41_06300 [Lachnospiraceae bacterium]|nr:hypothetical protein [Lachnospiraceae bacterium]